MKRIVLITMVVVSLGSLLSTHCFSLWPFKPQCDVSELKDFLSKRHVNKIFLDDNKQTLTALLYITNCPVAFKYIQEMEEGLQKIKSLPYVLNFTVTKLDLGTTCGSACWQLSIIVTLDAYNEIKNALKSENKNA